MERGAEGGYEELVRHINQAQRCVSVPALGLALGLGWAWPGERGAQSRAVLTLS